MNIQILDSWLRDHLNTKATPQEIAKYLSLSGPSVESVKKAGGDYVYDFEITTNRVDMMSVRGIAREAATILPQFKIKASLKPIKMHKNTSKKPLGINIKSNPKLTGRIMAVVLDNIQNKKTPKWMKDRLEASGLRSLNALIDITNYTMLDTGHPTHVFDYDLIKDGDIIVRESKSGETIIGLDNKKYKLPKGSIVFDNGKGKIIDLPGILGTKNSAVNDKTTKILFLIDNNDPVRIRKTSMKLELRTQAAIINEKGVDPYLGETAMAKGLELYKTVCKADVISKTYDHFSSKQKAKTIKMPLQKFDQLLGINIKKNQISSILKSLEYDPSWKQDMLSVTPPTFRYNDTNIPEDIIEEVARIYGYHNLPSTLMAGALPTTQMSYLDPIKVEYQVKQVLKNLGATEVFTLSLVSKSEAGKGAIKLKNPLGSNTNYLRTSLKPSLVKVIEENLHWKTPIHFYEIANIYLHRKNDLPNEKLMLAGIFKNYNYRNAKGTIESFLNSITPKHKLNLIGKRTFEIEINKRQAGHVNLQDLNAIYYEIDFKHIYKVFNNGKNLVNTPKHPPQIEDLTINLNPEIKIGELINTILNTSEQVVKVELNNIYKKAHTFRINYQSTNKTLTNKEVERLRKNVVKTLTSKFKLKI